MTQPVLVASIDQGTSSTRVIVFDVSNPRAPQIVAKHQTEFPQIIQKPGWCEHDPLVIWDSVLTCMQGVAEALGAQMKEIKAIGITNQRETTVVWDKLSGEPLSNAIVWLDGRTQETVKTLVEKAGAKDKYQEICGLPLTTYFSAVKLRWLLDNDEKVKKAAAEDRLMFGTVDSWLIYKLTGSADGGAHVTDVTNASRTMLLNLKSLQWDQGMIGFFGLESVTLPRVCSSAEVYGLVAKNVTVAGGAFVGIPVSGCLGDQQAALVGQHCFHPGEVKNTYGTGCFMLFNTGDRVVVSKNGLLTTVGYQLGKNAPAAYALEGSIAIAGAAVKWLRDNLGIIKEAKEVGELAAQVKDTAKVYFVPAFTGMYAPYWRDDARGVIVGLSQYSTKHHICRATLESVCWQSKEIMDVMNKEASTPLKSLKVDGGLSASDVCMQIQSDLLGIPVERPVMVETTALGAALAAGVGASVLQFGVNGVTALGSSAQAVAGNDEHCARFEPAMDIAQRGDRFGEWKRAVERSFNLA